MLGKQPPEFSNFERVESRAGPFNSFRAQFVNAIPSVSPKAFGETLG